MNSPKLRFFILTLAMLLFASCNKTPSKQQITEPSIEQLRKNLQSDDYDLRLDAIKQVQAIGPGALPLTEILVEGFFFWDTFSQENGEELHEKITKELSVALTNIGPEGAGHTILCLGTDEMEDTADEILYNMGRPIIPKLIKALEDEDTLSQIQIYWRVTQLLSKFGKDAQSAIPALEKAALYNDPDYKLIAHEAIKTIRESK